MALLLLSDNAERNMETRQQAPPQEAAPPREPAPQAFTAESSRPGVKVRVSILNARQDEEEKEAGYGHGV
jgi:hypothetical protein